MSHKKLITIGVIALFVMGWVRMLERPDAPEEVMGQLFRVDSVRIDPILLAACTVLHDPLERILEAPMQRRSVAGSGADGAVCTLTGPVPVGARYEGLDVALATFMRRIGWKPVSSQTPPPRGTRMTAYRRPPVTCRFELPEAPGEAATVEVTCALEETSAI
ncbi:MAG: hypothetical protein ACOCTG_02445 [Bacteroidota bacterium]